jgi:hypothetical protein
MEAVRSQPRVAIRAWRLLAVALFVLVLMIGGAAGYALRLATAPTQTIVHTAQAPAVSDQSSGPQCPVLPGPYHIKAC